MSYHFVGSAHPTLGVELELQLVDARTMALAGVIDEVIAEVPAEFRGSIKPEFYDSCVEINSGICRDVADVGRDLGAKLAAAGRIAGGHGVHLGWGGTHPFSYWRDQPVVPTPRYRELAGRYRETLCRQMTFGLHVHVGVADGEMAVRVGNRIAEHLPALLALSANSPFWCGRATGLHAHRVEVMGASPTGGLPPRLGGWDEYVRLVDRFTTAGLIGSPKELWWDVRPSPEHGTVEVRMCDMPPDLASVLGLTALIQCLVVELAEREAPAALDECGMMVVRQNRWRAARYGLGAGLVDPRTGCPIPAREAIRGLVARLEGVAEGLGCSRQLGLARAMADAPGGAERQLAVFGRTGDLAEVARHMTRGHVREPAPILHDPAGRAADPDVGMVARPAVAGCPLAPAAGS